MSKGMPVPMISKSTSDEVQSRILITLYLSAETLHFVVGETQDIVFAGDIYAPADVGISDISTSLDISAQKITLTFSDKNKAWAGYLASNGNALHNRRCLVQQVFADLLGSPANVAVLFEGTINAPHLTSETLTFEVVRSLGDYSAESPNMKFGVNCQYKVFKDARCGYTGAMETCDRTLQRCIQLGNVARFGGFPSIPTQPNIRTRGR